MLYGAPGLRLSTLELRLAPPHEFRLFGRQRVIGVNDALALDHHGICFLSNRHEVAHAHAEALGDFTGDDDLPSLPEAADGSSVVVVLLAMLSDYLTVRNCQAAVIRGVCRLRHDLSSFAFVHRNLL
jgi:hypothetical protein